VVVFFDVRLCYVIFGNIRRTAQQGAAVAESLYTSPSAPNHYLTKRLDSHGNTCESEPVRQQSSLDLRRVAHAI